MAVQTNTPEDVFEAVKEHDVRFVRLWFTDVLGHLKSFSINSSELERAFEQGIGFDGASLTGFNPVEESDMVARPDASTFSLIPWRPGGTDAVARMFCDIEVPGGLAYEGDPRWVLKRALVRASDLGFDDYLVAPELEFFYFRSARPAGGVPEVLDEGGYFDLTTLDAGSDVRRETVLALEQMGVHVASTHHEAGPSQHELDLKPAGALTTADDVMTTRIVVKEYAVQQNWHATFMPKPIGGANGSGMHLHQTLLKDGANAFFDESKPGALSQTAKAFIAGQLRHAREIAPLYAQWVNSYKRLVPGFEAPVYLSWSRRNRSSLIRVPQPNGGEPEGANVEIRCPDPACNPYLCLAGMLQAGLEGIEKGYELPEPMDENLYHLGPDDLAQRGIEQLPATLGESIELAADSELVLRTLGEHTFRRFIELKRQEWDAYRVQVTPFEVESFLPVL
ncbi:MAG: glutamine synthetase [Solirubrobacterales bacterium]|nr:glutamine synthetase [Solirubrobacterales bacterium]MCB0860739.1 glutamine synthetase [Solirubrobacterales bacterium]